MRSWFACEFPSDRFAVSHERIAQTNKLKIAEKKTQEGSANLTTAESKLLVVLKENQALEYNIKERESGLVKELGTTVEELKTRWRN